MALFRWPTTCGVRLQGVVSLEETTELRNGSVAHALGEEEERANTITLSSFGLRSWKRLVRLCGRKGDDRLVELFAGLLLGHECRGAGLLHRFPQMRRIVDRHRNDDGLSLFFFDPLRCFDAVHAWHVDVHDDDVRHPLL